MLVTPLPGADRRTLRAALRDLHTAILNVRGGGWPDPYAAYFEWTRRAGLQLSSLTTAADVDRLVFTAAYWKLLDSNRRSPEMEFLRQREVDQRVTDFEVAVRAVEDQIDRWARPGHFVVPDTSYFLEHPIRFDQADLHSDLELPWRDPIHLIVPIIVVDELAANKDKGQQRHRARLVLALLDAILYGKPQDARPFGEQIVREAAGGLMLPIGDRTVEIMFDPPRHSRLYRADDEIIDRAQVVQPLAGRELTLLTYDTEQAMRARQADLKVKKLKKTADEEEAERVDNAQHAKRRRRLSPQE